MSRLPKPGSDAGKWGDILNDYLSTAHEDDGTLKDNVVGSAQLQDDSVGSSQLQDSSVSTSHLQDGIVTESILASDVQTKLNASVTGSTDPTASTIVQRTASGAVRVADATNRDEAVSLGQVDSVAAGLVGDPGSNLGAALSFTFAPPSAFSGLRALLDRGLCGVLGVVGDSTGSGPTRWVNLLAQRLASRYPDATVLLRTFNSANLTWGRSVVQAGAADRKVTFDGATATGLVEGSSGTSYSNVVGDLDLRARIAPTKWSGGAGAQTILAKYGGAGQRVYRWFLGNSGKLYFDWTSDGSTTQAALASSVATGFADATAAWVRVTFQPALDGNTVATFYTSTDGLTWTPLGTPQTRAGTTALFSTVTQPCEIAARSQGQVELFAGSIYEVEIRNGIDGPLVCPTRPELWRPANSNYNGVVSGSPVIDIWNGSWSGAGLSAQLVPNRSVLLPPVGINCLVVSAGHNETTVTPELFGALDTLINHARTANPGSGIAISTQNPKRSPVVGWAIAGQARICSAMAGYAAQRGYTPIAVYEAFITSAMPLTDLVQADGTHPSDAYGSPLWADIVESAYTASRIY